VELGAGVEEGVEEGVLDGSGVDVGVLVGGLLLLLLLLGWGVDVGEASTDEDETAMMFVAMLMADSEELAS
jgi:hypothetical protein